MRNSHDPPRQEETQKVSYFNIPCYAYGTTGETKLGQNSP